MKIPMHIEFAWLMGKYHEKFSFWQYMQFCSIWAVFHSIVKSYWKENMVCIYSPSKLPTCIKYWWKKMNSQWIWLIFAIFDFLSDFVGLLWPFLGGLNASRIAKYDSCHQKPSWTGISAQKQHLSDYFCLLGFVTLKNRFLTFVGGPKWPPLRPRELKTYGCGA